MNCLYQLFFSSAALCYFSYARPQSTASNIWNDNLSQAEKNMILQQHNNFRSRAAKGQFPNKAGSRLGTVLPTAAKMPELQWDSQLESSAMRTAQRKKFEHSKDLVDTGENLYMFWTTGNFDRQAIIQDMTNAWANEIPQFGLDSMMLPTGSKFSQVGHATQVLADRTVKLGCAMVGMQPGRVLGVCHYGPIGNIINRPIYITGPTGSQCPAPSKLNSSTGLCTYQRR